MIEQLTPQERDVFFAKHFGATGNQEIRERKGAPLTDVTLGGRPLKGTPEYRAAHLALPPPDPRTTPAHWHARLEQIEQEIAASERKWADLGL